MQSAPVAWPLAAECLPNLLSQWPVGIGISGISYPLSICWSPMHPPAHLTAYIALLAHASTATAVATRAVSYLFS